MESCRSPLVEAALRASGVGAREELAYYLAQFKTLVESLRQGLPLENEAVRARYLFDWLWRSKPQRYQPGGCFRVSDVLDAEVRGGRGPVGNCLGLTVLYNTLAQELGLRVAAAHMERAFHGVPHVFTLLQADGLQIDVENVVCNGFDYSGHKSCPDREVWGDDDLVADIYLSRGNALFESRHWREAAACYDEALRVNPSYEKAQINRLMAVTQLQTG
ncbi:MAG: tetratricopeptide repeat protein [Chloroflexi bacterium]|nr:tetratricopeptide repeat protein [Chloroflexota bacterium]